MQRTPGEPRTPKITDAAGSLVARSAAGFADEDQDNSEEDLLKAKLAREIRAVIKARKLTQVAAASLLGLRQPDVSAIVTGRTAKFSIGRLLRCLDRLDCRVHFSVRPKPASERQALMP